MRVPSVRRFFCGVSSAGEVSAGNAFVSGLSAGAGFWALVVLLAGTLIPDLGVGFAAVADSLEGKAAVSGAFVVAFAVALVVRLTAFVVVFLTVFVAFVAVFVALVALAVVLAGVLVAFGFAESAAAAVVFEVTGLALAVAVVFDATGLAVAAAAGLVPVLSAFCTDVSLAVCAASFGLSAGLLALAVACAFFTPALTA